MDTSNSRTCSPENSYDCMEILCICQGLMLGAQCLNNELCDHCFLKRQLFVFCVTAPSWARASSLSRFLDLTQRRTSRQDSSGWVISSLQRPLPDNTQHAQQTNIHAPGGIWNHHLSRQADADLRLRPCGRWDWLKETITMENYQNLLTQSIELLKENKWDCWL